MIITLENTLFNLFFVKLVPKGFKIINYRIRKKCNIWIVSGNNGDYHKLFNHFIGSNLQDGLEVKSDLKNGDIICSAEMQEYDGNNYFYSYSKIYAIHLNDRLYKIGPDDPYDKFIFLMDDFDEKYWGNIIFRIFGITSNSNPDIPDVFKKYIYLHGIKQYIQFIDEEKCFINENEVILKQKKSNIIWYDHIGSLKEFSDNYMYIPQDIIALISKFSLYKNQCDIWYVNRCVSPVLDTSDTYINILAKKIDDGDIIISEYINMHGEKIYKEYKYFMYLDEYLYNVSNITMLYQYTRKFNNNSKYWKHIKETGYLKIESNNKH